MNKLWNNRLKNIYFILGVVGIVMTQLGLSDAHSWMEIGNVLLDLLQDPARLLATLMLMVGIYVDPTSKGFRDREQLEDKMDE